MEIESKLKLEKIFFSLFLVCIFIVALRSSLDWPLRASILVLLLGGIGLILALAQLGMDFWAISHEPAEAKGMAFDAPLPEAADTRWGALEIWTWLIGLYAAIWLVGCPIAVPLWVFAYSKFYGSYWITSICLTAVAWAFIYGIFERALHVPWPDALLF
jgi:hypothetical protein